ncbi:toprim domain-containing protein [Chitinophaga niabensis]|nr:toprim domain-containing protein [Chitinophaga niabensis]
MVDYLAKLGFYPDPKKSKGNDYWFNSPLNPPDTDPSFKVNLQKNTWFDFISWEGGTLVDFGKLYHKCNTIEEFLERFKKDVLSSPQPVKLYTPPPAVARNHSEILTVDPIKSSSLMRYLEKRMIDPKVAKEYCQEVTYRIGENTYYGIGFKNNSDGWAIRNPFMKSGVQPMDFTTIDKGYKKVVAFEGFFNFLSYATIYKGRPEMRANFCIWNCLGMFTRARAFMDLHETKDLYLDHGKGGDDYTRQAIALNLGYKDKRALYKGYDDFNDWHIKTGGALKQRKRLRR